MFHTRTFLAIDAFTAGRSAVGAGIPISENPFTPGSLDHTQWIIGYQWGPNPGEERVVILRPKTARNFWTRMLRWFASADGR